MFLPLSPTIAGGRAVFAAAVMASSAAAHVQLGGLGFDLPSLLIGFLLLVGVSWSTNRPGMLLAAAIAAQLVLHAGGAFTPGAHSSHLSVATASHALTPTMIVVHSVGAICAWLLMWRFEALWQGIVDTRKRVTGAFAVAPAVAPLAAISPACAYRRTFTFRLLIDTVHRRGPPVFA